MSAAPTTPAGRLRELLDAEFIARLDSLELLTRNATRGRLPGERRSSRIGRGGEFADHRRYVPGDDLRFVDWNIFARLDQLFGKLLLAEEDLTVHVVLDVSASMATGRPSKNLAARRLAAALGCVALGNRARLTLSAIADGLIAHTGALRARRGAGQLAALLLDTPAAGPTRFDDACRHIAALPAGHGVTIVLSDFLFQEGYAAGLRKLIRPGRDLYAIQILSPQELDPPLSGELELRDAETADAIALTVTPGLLESYRLELTGYREELRTFCARHGVVFVAASSAERVEPLVLNCLRRCGLLG